MYLPWRKSKIKPHMNFLNILIFCISSTLGPSLFLLAGDALSLLGSNILASLIAVFLYCFLIALIYSELATTIKMSGGEFIYIKETVGGLISFATGWLIWFGNTTFMSLSAIGFAQTINTFLKLSVPVWAVTSIVLMAIIKSLFAKKTPIGLIISLIIIVSMIVPTILSGNFVYPINFNEKTIKGVSFLFIFFLTFQNTVQLNEESKNPKKHIPLSMILTLLIAFAIYFFVFSSMLGNNASGFGDLFSKIPFGSTIFRIILMIAMLSSLNATMSAGVKSCYSLSSEGYMPKSVSKLSKNIPVNALWLTSIIAIILASSGALNLVANMINFIFILAAISVAVSSIMLRKKRRDLNKGFIVPFYPFFQIALIVLSLVLLTTIPAAAIFMSSIWIVIGIFFYILKVAGMTRIKMAFSGINLIVVFASIFVIYLINYGIIEIKSLEIIVLFWLELVLLISLSAFMFLYTSFYNKRQPSKNLKNAFSKQNS